MSPTETGGEETETGGEETETGGEETETGGEETETDDSTFLNIISDIKYLLCTWYIE